MENNLGSEISHLWVWGIAKILYFQKGEEEKAHPEAQFLTSRLYASSQKMHLAPIRRILTLTLESSNKLRRSKKGKKKKLSEGIC